MTVESGGTSSWLLLGALVGLIGLAVVVFVVALGYLRGQNDKPDSAERRKRRRQTAVPGETPDREPAELPALGLGGSVRSGEVMRVIRDLESGRVMVEVEGRRYERLSEIEEAQVGRRVLWAIADLIRFTGGMATNARAVRSASEGVAWDESRPGAASGGRAARSAPLPVLPEAGTDVSSPAKLGQTVSEFFRRGLSPPPLSTTVPEPGSFIGQIEAILQMYLQELERPLSYAVHVSAGPDQRLQIRVGSEVYGSVDEVPNLQVRALIQAAVDEWERRS